MISTRRASLPIAAATLFVACALVPGGAAAAPSCRAEAKPAPTSELAHAVSVGLTCAGDPGMSDWQYSRMEVTTSRTLSTFSASSDLGFVGHESGCSRSGNTAQCPFGNIEEGDQDVMPGMELGHRRRLVCPISIRVRYGLYPPGGGPEQFFPVPVAQPCYGALRLRGVPRRCVRRSFRVKVHAPRALRRFVAGSSVLDEQAGQWFVDFFKRRHGKLRRVRAPRGLTEGGAPAGFTLRVPARRLARGRYAVRIGIEGAGTRDDAATLSDYPSKSFSFARC